MTPTPAQIDAAVLAVHELITSHTSFDYTRFISAADLRAGVATILTAGMSVIEAPASPNQPLAP